jgi:AcrR family transcriptional regulator
LRWHIKNLGKKAGAGGQKSDADARELLLVAAARCLQRYGYAGLSTRRVADAARMPLSQIHYHFGSKDALVLAVLKHRNERLLERQAAMFAAHLPLWKRWDKACDFLDADLESGYVRILQELLAASWSNPDLAAAVREFLAGWFSLLTKVAGETIERVGNVGGLRPNELAGLVGMAFLGGEELLLAGFEADGWPVRRALRRFGATIRALEEAR